MQAVVLAGGLAKRMHPHTLAVPKALIEVAGRPFVEWQLERLAAAGLRDVVMCIGHLGQQIRTHVGDGSRFGVRAAWSEEGRVLLGTAGAIRAAMPLLEEMFLVTYGDSYLPFDYAEPLNILREKGDCDGVMAVYKNEGRWDVSNVATDGVWVLRYEKGGGGDLAAGLDHIDYGATALRRAVIGAVPEHEAFGLDAVQASLARAKRLRACVARERFFEIGSPEGLAELDRHLRQRTSS